MPELTPSQSNTFIGPITILPKKIDTILTEMVSYIQRFIGNNAQLNPQLGLFNFSILARPSR